MHELEPIITKAKEALKTKEADRLSLAKILKPFQVPNGDFLIYPTFQDPHSENYRVLNVQLHSQDLSHYQIETAWEAVGSLLSAIRLGGVNAKWATTFKSLQQIDKDLFKNLNLSEGELAIVSKLFTP